MKGEATKCDTAMLTFSYARGPGVLDFEDANGVDSSSSVIGDIPLRPWEPALDLPNTPNALCMRGVSGRSGNRSKNYRAACTPA